MQLVCSFRKSGKTHAAQKRVRALESQSLGCKSQFVLASLEALGAFSKLAVGLPNTMQGAGVIFDWNWQCHFQLIIFAEQCNYNAKD